MRDEISHHDLMFEAKLWLKFMCARIMPFKNDRRVHNEASVLISCLMTGVYINYIEIVIVQIWRKAHQKALSMRLPVVLSKLCARVHVRYFYFDVISRFIVVIDLD